MKLIIAGSRTLQVSPVQIKTYLDSFNISKPDTVVSGTANGIDKNGESYADFYHIQIVRFPAEWTKYGSRGGPIRNNKMAVYGDALLLIWDGKSSGSQHMKNAMISLKKPVYEIILDINEKK